MGRIIQDCNAEQMKKTVAAFTLGLWLVISVIGLLAVLVNWPPEQRVLSLSEKLLMPLLKFTIGALLTYVFGEPIVVAVKERILLGPKRFRGAA